MSKTIADQLLDIVTAVWELPEEAQQAFVHEMADRVSVYAASRLTQEQQAKIRRRLADRNPTYAAPEKVRAFFSRFGIRSARRLHI
jgi:hypothetical protein